jgi:hypothetical protein
VEADAGVPGREAKLGGSGRDLGPAEIDAADEVGVLGLQVGDEVVDARADGPLQVGVESWIGIQCFAGEKLNRTFPRVFAAVVIRNRVPQQPVEPSDRTLVVADVVCLLQAADEGVLKNLFRVLTIADFGREETQELAVVGL